MDSQKLSEIKNDPKKALDFAKSYKKEGKFEEALEMHEWYHFNVLSIKPSQYGVRLSFALGHWMKLSEVYPKAKQRLIEIRDEGGHKIKSGDWKFEDFHEVVNISNYLKDSETPIEVFKLICVKEPDNEKVSKCFYFAFKLLVDKGEAELLRKYLGNPLRYVTKYFNDFKENESSLKEHVRKMADAENKKDIIQEMEKSPKKIYINEISLLVQALKMLNRDKEIEEVYKAGKGIIPDVEYQKIFE